MDIIRDNIFLIILMLVGAISQWLKARSETHQNQKPDFNPAEIEEMLEQAERPHSRASIPPSRQLPTPSLSRPSVGTVVPAPAQRGNQHQPAPTVSHFDTSSELARQQQISEKLKEAKRTRGAREMSESQNPRKPTTRKHLSATDVSLKSRLANRNELRQAFVMKEILDKPLAFSKARLSP